MKCNRDCFNCTIPASKCHGGGNKTANTGECWATKHIHQESCGVHLAFSTGRRVGVKGYEKPRD